MKLIVSYTCKIEILHSMLNKLNLSIIICAIVKLQITEVYTRYNTLYTHKLRRIGVLNRPHVNWSLLLG